MCGSRSAWQEAAIHPLTGRCLLSTHCVLGAMLCAGGAKVWHTDLVSSVKEFMAWWRIQTGWRASILWHEKSCDGEMPGTETVHGVQRQAQPKGRGMKRSRWEDGGSEGDRSVLPELFSSWVTLGKSPSWPFSFISCDICWWQRWWPCGCGGACGGERDEH